MSWGGSNEALALKKYKEEKLMSGNNMLVITNSGLSVSPYYTQSSVLLQMDLFMTYQSQIHLALLR